MLKNVHYDTKMSTIHLWYQKDGDNKYDCFKWIPYVFVKNEQGTHKTIDGIPVDSKTFSSYSDYYMYCKDRYDIYENKVRPEIQFLSETYSSIEDNDIYIPKLKTYFLDIEVTHSDKFPKPENAECPIVLISLYDSVNNQSITFGEKHCDMDNYIHCKDEKNLLNRFFSYMNSNPCDVLSGWNIWGFDIPYIINRTKVLFGDDTSIYKFMSPIKAVRTWYSQSGELNVDIAGITILDYMDIYKWYSPNNLETYGLDFVANFELEKGKLDYSEYKDLRELYAKNWNKYVEYNIIDAKRVYELEEKLGYIKLVQALSLLTRVPMKYYHAQTQLIEGALLTYYRRNSLCAPTFSGGTQKTFEAAYVKEPLKGFYRWICDLDITSSYPTAIITLNMSPETYFGRILGIDEDMMMLYTKRRTFPEFDMLKETGYVKFRDKKLDSFNSALKKRLMTVSPCGSVFFSTKDGVFAILERRLFSERKNAKNEMIKLKKSLTVLRDDDVKIVKEKIAQLNAKQLAIKVLLNALFGILAVPYSRYFNVNIAEAITSCGRQTIKAGEAIANELLNNPEIYEPMKKTLDKYRQLKI